MKQVRFDKESKCCCKYITLNRWYDVIAEHQSTVIIQDNSNTICGYPKAWVAEEREI